jgi:3-deoxy-manno-octulosonate cytidylyltransferase (CMP-KDO synthetase)
MTMNQTVCIIPARAGSTRFPNKPLKLIAGRSMIERVWRIGCAALNDPKSVFVATDEPAIADHVRGFGGNAIVTSKKPNNGTERVLEASESLNLPDSALVVNLQGDAVLTPPWTIKSLVDACEADRTVQYATMCTSLSAKAEQEMLEAKKNSPSSGTLVVCDCHSNALYFSKTPIPFRHPSKLSMEPLKRHIGTYAYRVAALRTFCSLPAGILENIEKLEQLRVLENGLKMRVVEVDYRGRTHASVDAPSDVAVVEAIIAREGELT